MSKVCSIPAGIKLFVRSNCGNYYYEIYPKFWPLLNFIAIDNFLQQIKYADTDVKAIQCIYDYDHYQYIIIIIIKYNKVKKLMGNNIH